jgi:hypothetical protein
MQQLCIEYFYPLTEQTLLDLDFQPCIDYQQSKYVSSVIGGDGLCLTVGNGGVAWATVANTMAPSFTIDVDQMPITVTSKVKPNIFRRYIYKILGMKWKAK